MTLRHELDRMTTEKEFQLMIRELAQRCGWLDYCTWDSRRSPGGFPDLVLVKPPNAPGLKGRILFVELKSERGKITESQVKWLKALVVCNRVEVYFWRPSNWDGVCDVLMGKLAEESGG